MPDKNHFRYKIGKTETECNGNNKHAVRLAYVNTIMYWLLRTIAVIGGSGAVINILLKLMDTG